MRQFRIGVFSNKYPLSLQTSIILFIYALFFALSITVMGPSSLINVTSSIYVISLAILMSVSLLFAPAAMAAHVTILAWFQLVFFFPRFFVYLTFPPGAIGFVSLSPLTADEVQSGLYFLLWGTAALIFGFWAGSLAFRSSFQRARIDIHKRVLPLGPIIVFWGLCFLATYYIVGVLGVSIFSSAENWGSRMGWVMRIFDTDAALLILVVWALTLPKRSLATRIVILALLSAWLLMTIILGSRGGPLRMLILLGLVTLAICDDPRLSPRRLIAVVAMFFVANVAVYPISTIARFALGEVENPTVRASSEWIRNEFPPAPTEVSSIRSLLWSSEFVQQGTRNLLPITTRLGVVDYPLVIVSRVGASEVQRRYLSMDYALKNYINNMVPGELFPENDIMTSRVFTMAYRGASETHVRTYFLSEPWTSWGYAWIKGGFWGGLAVLGLLGALSQAGYRTALKFSGPMLAPYVATSWLFAVTLNGPLQLFGVDHWLTVASHFFMALATALGLIVATSVLLSKAGVQSRFWVIHEASAR